VERRSPIKSLTAVDDAIRHPELSVEQLKAGPARYPLSRNPLSHRLSSQTASYDMLRE
jgi:hypothetical protein